MKLDTPQDLDALAALVGQMTPGKWTVFAQINVIAGDGNSPTSYASGGDPMTRAFANASGIVALVNAAPRLIELARKGLEAERPCYCCRENGCLDGCRCRVGLEAGDDRG